MLQSFQGMKKAVKLIICTILLVTLALACLVACNDEETPTTFEVEQIESDYVLSFAPKGITATKGLIFYVGESETPKSYEYLARALAHRGYFVAIPKIEANHAVTFYDNVSVTNNVVNVTNSLISNNPTISFVLAGHLYGGNAVVRYIDENPHSAHGAILLSPTYFNFRQLYDENGEFLMDEDGNQIYAYDTLNGHQIPTLVLDVVEPDLSRLPEAHTARILQNATAEGFGANNSDFSQDKQNQIENQHKDTIQHVIAFLQNVF